MKHVKDLNEWQDHLQMQADQAGMSKEEWIASYGSSIQGVDEKNADGTISDDEDEEAENFMADVRFMTVELIEYIAKEADKIGGSFRAPGYEATAKKLIKQVMKEKKFKF
jgi:hypothetical protein|tara:strand:+ start:1063 stop:1392 length:330 start_codon:yes stop_codon:yes gene_type:complete